MFSCEVYERFFGLFYIIFTRHYGNLKIWNIFSDDTSWYKFKIGEKNEVETVSL